MDVGFEEGIVMRGENGGCFCLGFWLLMGMKGDGGWGMVASIFLLASLAYLV